MAEVPVARTGPTRAIFDRPSTPMLNAIGRICLALARHLKSGGVIVNEHVLDREQTRRHVDVLSRCFDFIHLNDLPRQLYRRGKKPFCLLTFDDGKRSNATAVAPELERLGVPAVFFVVSGSLDDQAPLCFARPHALLTRESKTAAFESSARNIAKVSEEIGEACGSFAFANGNYTAELAQHAIRCGAKMVMTTEPTWVDQRFPLWRLPRLQIFGDN